MDDGVRGSTALLLNVTQVAKRLGISIRTVWRLTSAGQLAQPVAIGRCKRWRRRDVEAFVESLAAK